MQIILYPLQSGDKGPEVRNLHEGFLALAGKMNIREFQSLVTNPDFLETFAGERRQEAYGEATRQIISAFQVLYMKVPPTGLVDEATAGALNGLLEQYKLILAPPAAPQVYSVTGTIYDQWIEPLAGAPVMIFDKDIRSEHLLAEGVTDDKGSYTIAYSGDKLTNQDKGGANLIVRVYGNDGSPLYTSPVYYNAASQLQADVNLGPRPYLGPSQFVSTLAGVRQFTGKLAIDELTENSKVHDLTFLLNKTGVAANILVQLVASFRFEKWTGLGAVIYYGILGGTGAFPPTQGETDALPADLDTTIEQAYINLWTLSVTGMMTALQQAAENNLITYLLLADQQQISARLQQLQTAPPHGSGSTQQLPPVYANIQTAGLNAAQQQAFLNLYSTTPVDDSFWTTLATDPNFQGQTGTAVISKLQAVFQLAGLTANNTALTAYIVQTYSIASFASLSALVSQTPADWVTIIGNSGAVPAAMAGQGGTLTGSTPTVQDLANTLATGIEQLFPTAVFADRFSKATTLTPSNKPYLTGILQSSDFNLLTSPAMGYLNTYVAKNPLPQGAVQETLAGQLMTMQRVYKFSLKADTAISLLGANIGSARQIYAMGQAGFTSRFQTQLGGTAAAAAVFNQATAVHTSATHLAGQLISNLNNPSGNALPNFNDQLTKSSLNTNYPDLANLFGMATSYCECVNCCSWLGTPAYLADLLDFLYLRQTTTGSKQTNARQVLLAVGRRPDLADIDLDCDNANTELPYIDIVNELLEDYIIPPVACFKITVENSTAAGNWVKTYLKAGTITKRLYDIIISIAEEVKNPICNITLLTRDATLSPPYITDDFNFPLLVGTTWEDVNLTQLVIRDQFITLKLYYLDDGGGVTRGNDPSTFEPATGGEVRLACKAVEETKPGTEPGSVPVAGLGTDTFSFTLIVQEIHETHLTTDVINTNPEYINTNVYNCLSDPFNTSGLNLWGLYPTLIPMSLPFDLYFRESNVYLQEMGIKRYSLIETFESEKLAADGQSESIGFIVVAYLGMSVEEAEIIFNPQPTAAQQAKFWGPLAAQTNVEVDLFLQASGLSFTQLQTLLTLNYINTDGKSAIVVEETLVGGVAMVDCKTSDMHITAMTAAKFDSINRFIRLWNTLNALTPFSMEELNACFVSPVMQAAAPTGTFAVNLYYFLQVMSLMNLSATQALALYQDIGTTGDGNLYQQLFQNRQISNPLVAAFRLPLNTSSLITDTHTNPGAIPVILTACGITNADLMAILALNDAYADLTLDNLSFIYACGLLAGALSIPVADLITFATLLKLNPVGWSGATPPAHLILPSHPSPSPAATFAFITAFNTLQQAGFDVDDLNYILTNQSNATPSLVPDATAVLGGLTSFRTAIQAAVTATTPVPDPQGSLLKKWLADPDLNWSPGIAAPALAILATAGSASYAAQVQNNLRFLQLLQLQYAVPSASVWLSQLPPIAFPDSTIQGIVYDQTHNYYLFYYGTMSSSLLTWLQSVATPDAATQNALASLQKQSQECPLSAVVLPGASISLPPTWIATAAANLAAFSGGTGVLGFTGAMSGPVYTALLAQSPDPTYRCALTQLFIASQGPTAPPTTYVQLAVLPAIALPDANTDSLTYLLATPANGLPGNELTFTEAMSAADALALLSLSTDASYQSAICALFTAATPGQTVAAPLSVLPAGWTLLPDISGLSGLSFVPAVGAVPAALCFKGQMQSAVKTAYDGLSTDATWTANIQALYQNGQSTVVASTPISALPSGLTAASFPLYGVSYTPASGVNPATLSYTGPMSDTTLDLLLQANADTNWAATVTTLYQNAQASLVSAIQFTLPSGLTDASFSGITGIRSVTTGTTTVLSATGQMTPATQQTLLALSTNAGYESAIGYLFAQTSAIIPGALPSIVLPLPDTRISGTTYTPGAIVFYNGSPNPNCMDEFNLLQLNDDPDYTAAIDWLYATPAPASPAVCIGAVVDTLPSITLPSSIPIQWLAGELSFTGQMQETTQYDQLKGLSTDTSYLNALAQLYASSQITSVVELDATALPAGVTIANLQANQVVCQQAAVYFVLSFTGLMSAATQTALLALSADSAYHTAINSLYTQSQTVVTTTVPLPALPPITIPGSSLFTYSQGVLYYTGNLPVTTSATLAALSTDPEYLAALNNISTVTSIPNSGTFMIFAPAPATPFAEEGFTLAAGSIEYIGGTIGFTGAMSFPDYVGLLALSPDAAYEAVLNDVFVRSQTSAGTIQSKAYLSLPPLSFPAMYANQLSYAEATNSLTLLGYISTADLDALTTYSKGLAWQQALETLYNTVNDPGYFEPGAFPALYEALWPETAGVLVPPAGAALYAFFLDQLSVVYQPIKEAEALQSAIAANFSVSLAVAGVVANGLPALFRLMTDPGFIGNSRAINPDPSQSFQALWYMKLARITFLVSQFNLAAADTQWLMENAVSVGGIDLSGYPSASAPVPFSAWTVVNNLCTFQRTFPPQQVTDPADPQTTIPVSVYTVISAAKELAATLTTDPNPGALLEQLILLTGWNNSELLYLLNIGQPNLPNLKLNPLVLKDTGNPAVGCATDLSDISILLRLTACFAVAGQVKVVPSRCVVWTTDPLTSTTAADIKQALKSQYPDATSWAATITPLTNTLRMARRDALVAYLLSNVVRNVFGNFKVFADEFAIYGNFLIDVEMGACQPTTRIVQAYCSVQLFVTRCFLSLELPSIEPDVAKDGYWAEWAWMGTFEGWYRARYTFLFPENLVLPQTLPSQTSLFQDLQNDLTQGSVTPAAVETAFENYIEGLDEIAKLQICGTWYDDPTGNVYVFACSNSCNPPDYFFRVYNPTAQWGPWQQITADISTGQIIPLVQNGRLFLYWPIFTLTSDDDTTSQPVPAQGGNTSSPPPTKYWSIAMAFSEYINGQWSGKKVSQDSISTAPIAVSPGTPLIYPDTDDFVFIPLDIPPSSSDALTATQQNLRINNTMAIACYQYSPDKETASINFSLSVQDSSGNAHNVSDGYNVSANVLTDTIKATDLVDDLNDTYGSDGVTFDLPPGNNNVTLPLDTKAMTSELNDLDITLSGNASGASYSNAAVTFQVTSISTSPVSGNSDKLKIVPTSGPGWNAFQLDPLRGFPTPVDLGTLFSNYTKSIPHLWWNESAFDNDLLDGSTPLTDARGVTILKPKNTLQYTNLLPLQMGLWAKYNTVKTGKLDLTKLGILMPAFYQGGARTFLLTQAMKLFQYKMCTYPEAAKVFEGIAGPGTKLTDFENSVSKANMTSGPYYQFTTFYHPFAHYFIRIVAQEGSAGVITRAIQLTGDPTYKGATEVKTNPIHKAGYQDFDFADAYGPQGNVRNITGYPYTKGYPVEQMDFDPGATYSQYNWELFFHSVLLSGILLTQNQQFAAADACLKLIFNPADASGGKAPEKYWVTKPFYKHPLSPTIEELVTLYILDPTAPALKVFAESVNVWKLDPYDPHMLALARITPYMYSTFMKYLDNLIAWANFNYQQYTMESVNIAIQLFMLALELLGTEPQAIPPVVEEPICTYNQLESNLDGQIAVDGEGYLSDPIVQVENLLPVSGGSGGSGGKKILVLKGLYFCIPQNQVLLGYWNVIETQLTKIRNCLNIQGQFQPLSPFPSIPGLNNLDGAGTGDFGGILPNYRFTVMIQKAIDLCNEVKSLGAALLSALEKQDAEGLALLRASQEIAVQQSIDQIKQMQITDAQLGLQNLENYQQLVSDKIAYYSGLIQQGLIPLEQQALLLNQFSLAMQGPITAASIVAKAMSLTPDIQVGAAGFGGSPTVTVSIGGSQMGGAADAFVQFMSFLSTFADKSAALANTNATYARRMAEWTFQLGQANDEMAQVTTQIQAAKNKIAIATQDEKNQQLLITNAQAVDDFLINKYTNQQLYTWMVTKLSNTFFQLYQLAYQHSKKTEVCFGFELGITGTSYIQYGYWDTLHKGLLSGEALMSSLRQMEVDYLSYNVREYELTRQISLAQFDPIALMQLKTNNSCIINIPEELFDLDYPGHYFRRIKHVAVTLPGVVGPYTPVCLKMTLLNNSIRIDNTAGTAVSYPRRTDSQGNPVNDSRFLDNVAATQYIATSSGVNDHGLFDYSQNDERYVPFERAGAISTWQLEFLSVYPQFDPKTLTETIIHFFYTARDGGALLQQVAAASVQSKLASVVTASDLVLMRGFSARRDFPTQWYKFLNPQPGDEQQLVMDITRRFPFFTNGLTIKISGVVLMAVIPAGSPASEGSGNPLDNLYLSGTKISKALLSFVPAPGAATGYPEIGSTLYSSITCKDTPGTWTITNGTGTGTTPPAVTWKDIEDLSITFYYSLVSLNT
jgi:hypothetical protein